jgi:hypothetical protein
MPFDAIPTLLSHTRQPFRSIRGDIPKGSSRNRLLYGSQDLSHVVHLLKREQHEMDMIRHKNISPQQNVMLGSNILDLFRKPTACSFRLEKVKVAIATEG